MSDESDLADALLSRAPVAIVVCDPTGTATWATPYAARLLGADPVGRDLGGLVAEGGRTALTDLIAALAAGRSGTPCDVTPAAATERVLEVTGAPPAGGEGIAGVVLALVDVTASRARIAELQAQLTTDPLTGLPNRRTLEQRLTRMARDPAGGCIAVLDLDEFKALNDAHGHAAGDEVLAECGRRLADAIATVDGASAGRVGGEEFAVLLPRHSVTAAEAVVEGLRAELGRPHPVVGAVTASAGLAAVPAADEIGARSPGGEALRRAEAALYTAKASGRDRLVVHQPAVADGRASLRERIVALERERERLAREARTDALTDLPNRRRLEHDLDALHAVCLADGSTYSVVFIDLDHFGQVNKEWSQEAGDQVLEQVARGLEGALRSSDVLYRHGGEELVALLPDTTLGDALVVGGRMREGLRALALPHPTLGAVTASFGVASLDAHRREGARAVLRAADGAMRRAKAAGRDRIEHEAA